MPIPTRVAIFERNLLWHVAALGAGFAYTSSVVGTTEKVALGPMCFLFICPLLAALRVRAASMLDQAAAYRRAGVVWLGGNQTLVALCGCGGGQRRLARFFAFRTSAPPHSQPTAYDSPPLLTMSSFL